MVIGIVLGVLFGVLEGMTSALLGGIVVALITLLLNAIFTPVSVAYLYLLYKDLKAASGSVAEPAPVAGGQSFNEVM